MTRKLRVTLVLTAILFVGGVWWGVTWFRAHQERRVEAKADSVEITSLPTLSGTSFQTNSAQLAPAASDWPSEEFAERASGTLAKLTAAIQQSPTDDASLQACCATEFSLTFNSEPPRTVFTNEQLSVDRVEALIRPKQLKGLPAVAKFVAMLPASRSSPTSLVAKIVKVDFQLNDVSTVVYAESDCHAANQAWQKTSRWECRWMENSGGDLQLASAKLLDMERVHRHGAPWFVDRTLAVIGQTQAFREQLSHGLQYWLARIETAHGMNYFSKNGLAIADINGDGRDDLYVCQPGGLPNRLFIQRDDGTVLEQGSAFGLDLLDRTSSAVFVDLDNDGDQDAAIATMMGVCIFENVGPKFHRRQVVALADIDLQGISAVDYDNDGDLDLYQLVDYASGTSRSQYGLPSFIYHDANDGGANRLLQNNIRNGDQGDWEFRDVTEAVGLDVHNHRHSLAAAWEDFDNDGDQDLYVANDYGANCLYRNDAGKFSEVAADHSVVDFGSGMSVSWGDYNRDGLMDLYVGNMYSSAGNRITPQSSFLPNASEERRRVYQRFAKGNSLFSNQRDSFRETGDFAAVEMGRWAWSSLFCDVNNDGWDDLLVANGYITTDDSGDL